MAKKKDLKAAIEAEIIEMLETKDKEPSEGRMKALALGIKMCALNAKLEESSYGDFFNADESGLAAGDAPGQKSHPRKRANGDDTPAIE